MSVWTVALATFHSLSNSDTVWMEVSQNVLNSARTLPVAQLVLRSCKTVHLTYKQFPLSTDATALYNCGIWVTGRNHSWICREQTKKYWYA